MVGHDWGAAVAWGLAMEHPQRLRTITALSVAHPAAFRRSMLTSSQALHSWYMGFFQIPGLADALMGARDLRPFEQRLRRDGVPPEYAQRYREHFAKLGSLTTAINWYRGMRPVADARPIVVSTPCLLIWGNRDPFLTRKSVDLTARYVSGPYRLDVLDGIGHWIPETAPDRVVELLLPHLRGALCRVACAGLQRWWRRPCCWRRVGVRARRRAPTAQPRRR